MKNWLSVGSKEDLTDSAFMGERVLIDLFIKYNTAIPSSAAVERLFSIGKDILTSKRAKLSDANFERLMFMKGNQHHVAGMQAEQAASGRKSQINKPWINITTWILFHVFSLLQGNDKTDSGDLLFSVSNIH